MGSKYMKKGGAEKQASHLSNFVSCNDRNLDIRPNNKDGVCMNPAGQMMMAHRCTRLTQTRQAIVNIAQRRRGCTLSRVRVNGVIFTCTRAGARA